jgi:hypothetical protein
MIIYFSLKMLLDLPFASYQTGTGSALSGVKWKKLDVKTELHIGPNS